MVDAISPEAFHAHPGVADWRILFEGAVTRFDTGSFAKGVALVEAIGRLADEADHHPDVDLRYGSVTVRTLTHEVGGLTQRDASLAAAISAAAAALDIPASPTAVATVQLAIDAVDKAAVMPFWRALLGYAADGDDDLVDPAGRTPGLWFQQMDEPRAGRNRLHVDVSVAPEEAAGRIAAALAAGGRLVSDAHAPAWWTLADPEGNEADVATWQGRD